MVDPQERRNEAHRARELWQPPAFDSANDVIGRTKAALRRTMDLQAASIWRGVRGPLGAARGTVLDVGAGAQPYRSLVGGDATYRAIDTAQARENFGYEVPDTEYFTGDRWPVDDTSVDVLIATETLEHVPDPGAFLAQARRVLRERGQLVLTVPFSARWHYFPYDYWRFTPSGLQILLDRAGFTSVVVHARGNEVTVAAAKCIALILPFLMPQDDRGKLVRLVVGLALSPLLLTLGIIGQISLRRQGGDDCLGYTVFAAVPPTVSAQWGSIILSE